MLASFERRRFDRVTRPEPGKQTRLKFNSEMKAFFGSFPLRCFAKIFKEICVENYKELS